MALLSVADFLDKTFILILRFFLIIKFFNWSKKFNGNLDELKNYKYDGSKLGAWASNQSQIIKDRTELEAKIKFYEEKFNGQDVPRPDNWGGYCLNPNKIEFWQGRPSRLHDRIVYVKENNQWAKSRLSP